MPYTAQQILNAFSAIAPGAQHEPRGGTPGYVRIYGPSANTSRTNDCFVIVEHFNGAVCFTQELRAIVRATPRPLKPAAQGQPPQGESIKNHPLGGSSGPHYGRFEWGLTPDEIAQRFPGSAEDFVLAILGAFQATGTLW
jgi:hypothetical protein